MSTTTFDTNSIVIIGRIIPAVRLAEDTPELQTFLTLSSTNVKRFTYIDNIFSVPLLRLEIEISYDKIIKLDFSALFNSAWYVIIDQIYKSEHSIMNNLVMRVIDASIYNRNSLVITAIPIPAYELMTTKVLQKQYSSLEQLLNDFGNTCNVTFDSSLSSEFLSLFGSDPIYTIGIDNIPMFSYLQYILTLKLPSTTDPAYGILRFTNNSFYIDTINVENEPAGSLLVQSSAGYNYADFDSFVETILTYDIYLRNYRNEITSYSFLSSFDSDVNASIDSTLIPKLGAWLPADDREPVSVDYNHAFTSLCNMLHDDLVRFPVLELHAVLQGNFLLKSALNYSVFLSDTLTTSSVAPLITSADGVYYATQLVHDIQFNPRSEAQDTDTLFMSALTLVKNATQVAMNAEKQQHPYKDVI